MRNRLPDRRELWGLCNIGPLPARALGDGRRKNKGRPQRPLLQRKARQNVCRMPICSDLLSSPGAVVQPPVQHAAPSAMRAWSLLLATAYAP
jgi:hypothetical protein